MAPTKEKKSANQPTAPKLSGAKVDKKHVKKEEVKKSAANKLGKSQDDFEALPSSSDEEDEEDEFNGFDSTDEENEESEDESDNESENNKREKQKNQLTEQQIKDLADDAVSKASKNTNNDSKKESRGVVYVGRIPHGFFETQMQSYFSQFGKVVRLRLSRNRKTGQSKHFAFVEFESEQVAKVVAETMDNYLLFGHILKVKLVPQEQVHEKMFWGANRRFKVVPWMEIQKEITERKRTQKEWDERQQQELERRKGRQEKLADLGIEYSY